MHDLNDYIAETLDWLQRYGDQCLHRGADVRVMLQGIADKAAEEARATMAEQMQMLQTDNKRLRWRLNHQTDADVATCQRGLHGPDCGA